MFVTADEVVYDDVRKTSSAVGSVKLYYGDATLEADRVVYDQTTGKVYAYGNVRLNDQGNVYQSDHMVLTDNFRDGFVQSLLVEGADKTRFAAARATRTGGNVVVFDKGVYTACPACLENPSKPPLWQVKAARIIHDSNTKTIYYEDATIEFFGKPIAWLPFFSHADATVKRKTGVLMPSYMSSTEYGVGVRAPYYWALKPNMDVTFSPTVFSEQGIMPDVEFRHRTMEGAYSIRAAGIFQQNTDLFGEPDQKEEFRGAITSKGEFRINDFWTWGWDANLLSDKWFLSDYDLWGANWSEAVNTAHLTGIGERNYFELRGYQFYGLSQDDVQEQLPIVGVWDYNYVHDKPVLGGEWAMNFNLTNTWREETDFEPTTAGNVSLTDGGPVVSPSGLGGKNLSCSAFDSDCAVPGVGGTYTRFTADTSWRREFIDPIGQIWTPFAFARGDVMYRNPDDNPDLANYINTDEETLGRGMIGVGLEYRYPFVAESSIGTHILEPIAQVILRPNETQVGEVPNEDAQSLFFDTSTLFSWDKFSGYDRIEGGGRANLGVQYTLNMNNGGFAQLMFGQSYQLYGDNSFAETDLTQTGLNSGLETDVSDYVASGYLKVSRELGFSSRFRFDEKTFEARATELEAKFTKGKVTAAVVYGSYDAQPQLGFERAEGVVASTKLNVTDNYFLLGAARYNIETEKLDRAQIGAGYLDECFSFGLNYAVDFSENGNDEPVHKIFFRMALRTLGEAGTSFDVSKLIKSDNDGLTP
jgi:LPS-assembly protein